MTNDFDIRDLLSRLRKGRLSSYALFEDSRSSLDDFVPYAALRAAGLDALPKDARRALHGLPVLLENTIDIELNPYMEKDAAIVTLLKRVGALPLCRFEPNSPFFGDFVEFRVTNDFPPEAVEFRPTRGRLPLKGVRGQELTLVGPNVESVEVVARALFNASTEWSETDFDLVPLPWRPLGKKPLTIGV